jgi:regulator of protease activity HflC (stomatin/prohibitin superfamily)
MITTSIIIMTLLIAGIIAFRTREKMWKGTGTHAKFNYLWLIKPAAVLLIGYIISRVHPYELYRVEQGEVGVKVNLSGNERGISDYHYATGWTVVNTWTEQLKKFPTNIRNIKYPHESITTKGGFPVDMNPTFNYQLRTENVGDMYQQLKVTVDQIEAGWLHTTVMASIADVANNWSADQMFNDLAKFEGEVRAECNKRVGKWFTLSQIRLKIITPTALEQSLIDKNKAEQTAQIEEKKAIAAINTLHRKVAEARADSADRVIRAAGRAEEIRREQASLTENYIEYKKVEKWDGKLPTTTLGSNTPMINIK